MCAGGVGVSWLRRCVRSESTAETEGWKPCFGQAAVAARLRQPRSLFSSKCRELEAGHRALAPLLSPGRVWPARGLPVPLAVCRLRLSHAAGCEPASWPLLLTAGGEQQLGRWEGNNSGASSESFREGCSLHFPPTAR